MPPPPPLADALLRHLRVHGPTSGAALRDALGVSQPTFSRAVATLGDEVIVVGRARATHYAARRSLPGLPRDLPVYEVGPAGTRRLATLRPVYPYGYHVDSASALAGFHPDLPWFLHDLRPAGFLGRLVPRRHADLGLPGDITRWSTDQVVGWLHGFGSDLVGNLVLGDPAFRRLLAAPAVNPVAAAERSVRYAALADDAMAAGVPGSSAGGEQPKFLATRLDPDPTPVLVKFSPPVRDPVSRRVADLLWCEHLALAAVRRAGLAAASSEVLVCGERVVLEVERFDRVGPHGRRGMVSLLALDMAFVGSLESWTAAAQALHTEGRIDAAALADVVWLERFGDWIGNTDRHAGNLSFFFEEGRLGGLTPLYDMTPMRYAPRSGELVPVTLPLPTPDAVHPTLWHGAWRAAAEFWGSVAEAPGVSPDFRAVAALNAQRVAAQAPVLARLPRP